MQPRRLGCIVFLLALCCREDLSATSLSRDEDLGERIHSSYEKVAPIIDNVELREKLKQ